MADRLNLSSNNLKQVNQTEQGILNKDYSAANPFVSPSRDNYQTYPYDYFCGTDCKVYFGDIWVDDIVTIQYSINQSKTPIYGYASQTFDAVARGQVLVQGTLSIAFKEVGYLNTIQYILEGQRDRNTIALAGKVKDYSISASNGTAKYIPGLSDNINGVTISPNGTPQIIRQQQTIEDILSAKKGNSVASGLWTSMYNNNYEGKDFEDFAEALEDTIWGDSNGKPYELRKYLRRADEFDYKDNGGVLVGKDNDYSQCLNILLTFGDINDFRAEHTLVSINDVHFTGVSMILSPDGNPIAEVYQFFARDINRSIEQSNNTFRINPIKLNTGTNAQLSKLSDIDAIEKQLSNANNIQIRIDTLSKFTSKGWNPSKLFIAEELFESSKTEPFIDQLTKTVEQIFNDNIGDNQLDASQWLISTELTNSMSSINMVLEQTFPNTRTYRVISPQRDNYCANNVLSRDDIWKKATIPSNKDIDKENKKFPIPDFKDSDPALASKIKSNNDDISPKKEITQVQNITNVSAPSGVFSMSQKVDPDYRIKAISDNTNVNLNSVQLENNSKKLKVNTTPTPQQQEYLNKNAQIFMQKEQQYNLPTGLLAENAFMESSFEDSAVSPTGALGSTQLTSEGVKAIAKTDPNYAKQQLGLDVKTATNSDYYNAAKKISSDSSMSIDAEARLMSANREWFIKKYGREPTNADQRAMYVGGANYKSSDNSQEAIQEQRKYNQLFSDKNVNNTKPLTIAPIKPSQTISTIGNTTITYDLPD